MVLPILQQVNERRREDHEHDRHSVTKIRLHNNTRIYRRDDVVPPANTMVP